VEKRQEGIADGTTAVQDSLQAMFPDSIPPPVEKAASHLDSSLVDQDGALERLTARQPGRAAGEQEHSLDQLKKALEALTKDQDGSQGQDQPQEGEQQQQQQQQQQEQQQEQQQVEQQERQNETAQGILEEEKENKEKQHKAGQGYRSVDKDW